MAHSKKRSRAEHEAPMADISAPKAGNSSSASALRPNSNPPGGSLNLPSSHRAPRRQSALAASSAIAKAAQDHGLSGKEIETAQPKRVKKVTFTEETKAEILGGRTPASASLAFITPAFTIPAFTTPAFTAQRQHDRSTCSCGSPQGPDEL